MDPAQVVEENRNRLWLAEKVVPLAEVESRWSLLEANNVAFGVLWGGLVGLSERKDPIHPKVYTISIEKKDNFQVVDQISPDHCPEGILSYDDKKTPIEHPSIFGNKINHLILIKLFR